MTPVRKAKFDKIIGMEATDDERVAAYVRLAQEDWDEEANAMKGVKLLARDGSLHDIEMRPRPKDYISS